MHDFALLINMGVHKRGIDGITMFLTVRQSHFFHNDSMETRVLKDSVS